MKKTILAVCLVALSAAALAQQQELVRGKALRDLAVGNTFHVYHPGCTDKEANFIVFFAEDGKAYAKDRPCKIALDRASSLTGR